MLMHSQILAFFRPWNTSLSRPAERWINEPLVQILCGDLLSPLVGPPKN